MKWKRPLSESTKRRAHAVLTSMITALAGLLWTAFVLAGMHLRANGHLEFEGARMALYDMFAAGAVMAMCAMAASVLAAHEIWVDVKKIKTMKPAAAAAAKPDKSTESAEPKPDVDGGG